MQSPTLSSSQYPTERSSHGTTQSDIAARLTIEYLIPAQDSERIEQEAAQEVVHGLTQAQKSLPPRYFYDDYGSHLFEQICQLPEYYLTRTETALFQHYASAIAQKTGACDLIELGSGSSTKTRLLLDAYQTQHGSLSYVPVDVSAGILKDSACELLNEYEMLHVHGLVSTYEKALQALPSASLPQRMIAFIGSTLGNLAPTECDRFLAQIAAALQPGEFFLLGIDLQKPVEILEAAYNDAQGVTAAFNLNMLQHLNSKFDGDFKLSQFEHHAFYNSQHHQIEMHLRSRQAQTVQLRSLNLAINFEAGETILSEISRKFDLTQMKSLLTQQGLAPIQSWMDEQQWYGLILCKRH